MNEEKAGSITIGVQLPYGFRPATALVSSIFGLCSKTILTTVATASLSVALLLSVHELDASGNIRAFFFFRFREAVGAKSY